MISNGSTARRYHDFRPTDFRSCEDADKRDFRPLNFKPRFPEFFLLQLPSLVTAAIFGYAVGLSITVSLLTVLRCAQVAVSPSLQIVSGLSVTVAHGNYASTDNIHSLQSCQNYFIFRADATDVDASRWFSQHLFSENNDNSSRDSSRV